MDILIINNKKEEKFLRQRTPTFDFSKFSKKEIFGLIKLLREKMKEADGIGLSANQLGLSHRVFVAMLPSKDGRMKFYSVFNPEIEKISKGKELLTEGCLSVPDILGDVERPEKATIVGFDKNGRKIKIKSWGLLARVFQHEIDHLNGVLFIDKAKKIYKDISGQSYKI